MNPQHSCTQMLASHSHSAFSILISANIISQPLHGVLSCEPSDAEFSTCFQSVFVKCTVLRQQVSAQKLYCQMLSSVTGKQLDAVVFTKPANWKPSHAAQRSFAASCVSKYKPSSTPETTGASRLLQLFCRRVLPCIYRAAAGRLHPDGVAGCTM